MKWTTLLLAAALVSTAAHADTAPAPAPAPSAETEAWRAGRLQRLTAPEGWLSLIGLHWIEPGTHTIGGGDDDAIEIAALPAHFGTIASDGKVVTFTPGTASGTRIDDAPAAGRVTLASDASGQPTVVRNGTVSFTLIERSGRYALRVKDSDAKTRTGFVGLDYYDYDPSLRVDARFEKHAAGKTIPIATVINTIEPMPNPGAVVFERDGKTHRLEAVDEGDGQLFLIFADRTNGKETYGAGRFLYARPPADGSDRVVVDFNQSYNPPCVFTPYATCPLPPPENRLDLFVRAGEKKYRAAAH